MGLLQRQQAGCAPADVSWLCGHTTPWWRMHVHVQSAARHHHGRWTRRSSTSSSRLSWTGQTSGELRTLLLLLLLRWRPRRLLLRRLLRRGGGGCLPLVHQAAAFCACRSARHNQAAWCCVVALRPAPVYPLPPPPVLQGLMCRSLAALAAAQAWASAAGASTCASRTRRRVPPPTPSTSRRSCTRCAAQMERV